jgi:hypothetical protein
MTLIKIAVINPAQTDNSKTAAKGAPITKMKVVKSALVTAREITAFSVFLINTVSNDDRTSKPKRI